MGQHYKFSPALITPFSANAPLNKLAANLPNTIGKNPPFCYFASFLIVSLIPLLNNPDSSNDSSTLLG